MKKTVEEEFSAHIETANSMHLLVNEVVHVAELCIKCIKNGGKILLFGNGGSAADAQHIAAELVGRYKTNRQGIAAIALTTDTSVLTSVGNDFGFNVLFARQIEAIAKTGDIAIGISTSGSSENIIKALKLASKLQCVTIGFSGNNGGEMNKFCDINLIAPSSDTPRIQEMHILIGHVICHLIDQEFKA